MWKKILEALKEIKHEQQSFKQSQAEMRKEQVSFKESQGGDEGRTPVL